MSAAPTRPDPTIRRSSDLPGWVVILLVAGIVANTVALAVGVFS